MSVILFKLHGNEETPSEFLCDEETPSEFLCDEETLSEFLCDEETLSEFLCMKKAASLRRRGFRVNCLYAQPKRLRFLFL